MMMKSVKGEKRGLERFDLKIPARIELSHTDPRGEALSLFTRDISSGGAFFHTSEPLLEGTKVEIELILPMDKLMKNLEQFREGYQHTNIKLSGTVLRKESTGMAIIFNKRYKIGPWKGI